VKKTLSQRKKKKNGGVGAVQIPLLAMKESSWGIWEKKKKGGWRRGEMCKCKNVQGIRQIKQNG